MNLLDDTELSNITGTETLLSELRGSLRLSEADLIKLSHDALSTTKGVGELTILREGAFGCSMLSASLRLGLPSTAVSTYICGALTDRSAAH